jgi:hypothetical protein
MPVETTKIFQVVVIGTQERIDDAAKMWCASSIENSGAPSSPNKRLDISSKIGVLLLDLAKITKLDNDSTPASANVERLRPQHSCGTLSRRQWPHQDALGLIKQAAE